MKDELITEWGEKSKIKRILKSIKRKGSEGFEIVQLAAQELNTTVDELLKDIDKFDLVDLVDYEIKENIMDNTREEFKEYADANWEYNYDIGAGHSSLYNAREGLTIFPPYDAKTDDEGYYDTEPENDWVVQLGSDDGNINEYYWFDTENIALAGIDNLKDIWTSKEPPLPTEW